MWLDGGANSEKSAICHAVAKICSEWHLLSGSVSLRGMAKNSTGKPDASRLIATLVYQLLQYYIPQTRNHIAEKIAMDISILDRSLETQLNTLLVQPLVTLDQDGLLENAQSGSRLFIIDGLDECDEKTQCLVVESFTAALEKLPESISHKLLFSSQSESHLVSTCRKSPTSTRLRRLHLDDSLGIQLSPVESFMDLRGNLHVLHHELSGYRAEVDELEKRHSELEKREEELQKREEEWKQKEAELQKKAEWFRKKSLEMLRKEEEEKRREEERQRNAARAQIHQAELLEMRRGLQQMQRLKEEIAKKEEKLAQKEQEISRKEQEKSGQACGRPPVGGARPPPKGTPPPLPPRPRHIPVPPPRDLDSDKPPPRRDSESTTLQGRWIPFEEWIRYTYQPEVALAAVHLGETQEPLDDDE